MSTIIKRGIRRHKSREDVIKRNVKQSSTKIGINKLKYIFLFIFLSLVIIFIWFIDGRLLAKGEDGLFFFDLHRTFNTFSNVWINEFLGSLNILNIPKTPYFYILSLFARFFPSWFLQALTFCVILFIGSYGMFLLTKEVIKENKVASVVSALFYIFNIYSLTQVWDRFIFTGLFAWGYLPLFLYLWIKWLREGLFRNLFLLLFLSLMFSLIFSSPVFVFTFFTPVLIWFFVEFIGSRNSSYKIKLLFKLLLAGFLWIITNIWWIYLLLTSVQTDTVASGEASNWKFNFDSLRGVSIYFPTNQILLLRQSYLLGQASKWFDFYKNSFSFLTSYLILGVVLYAIYLTYKRKNYLFLFSLALISWFIVKGVNPPFGFSIYRYLFSHFIQTNLLRNPYEKFGIVWVLVYSIFFGVGIDALIRTKNWIFKAVAILTVVFSLVLVWPLWTGNVFQGNIKAEVPQEYIDVNEKINSMAADGRILVLPLQFGDGIGFRWGYQGLEPSDNLFDRPTISRVIRTDIFDYKYKEVMSAFENGTDTDIKNLLNQLNVKYIIIHYDIAPANASIFPVSNSKSEEIVSKLSNTKLIMKNKDLALYFYDTTKSNLIQINDNTDLVINYLRPSSRIIYIDPSNLKGNHELVFKETFNPNWKLLINGVEVSNHYIIYGYANAWKIDNINDKSIVIKFKIYPWE